MIKEIEHLTAQELREFYAELSFRLLAWFSTDNYIDEEELQMDFDDWKNGMGLGDYHRTVDRILEDISPPGIDLNWRHLKKLSYKRWHLCSECGKPFIAYGSRNKDKTCSYKPYSSFVIGSAKKAGHYYKQAGSGRSQCYIALRTRLKREARKKEKNLAKSG